MKTLYIGCNMGAAGDMLTAALCGLMPDPEGFAARLNGLGIPGVVYALEPSVKCGITGLHMKVTVNGEEEESEDVHGQPHDHEHEHDHEHDHDHEHVHGHHHHSHTSLHGIGHIVRDHLDLPEKVKDDVMAVYSLIAEAESAAHGVPAEEIHFHEVGAMDAVADVTAVCLAMAELNPDQVVVSPVHVGAGQVRCAHGILPVPAPATAYILRDVPTYGGAVMGELCTPTGAALLKHFASRFGDQPVMRVEKIGYGMGKKDFEAANCVRAMLGETEAGTGEAAVLSCNLDDMTPEDVGFAMDALFEGGALDVWTAAAGMKKNRPGWVLNVLCRPEDREKMVRLLFRHTSTIGVREETVRRYTLERRTETVSGPCGEIRKKISAGYGVTREKYEYDDLSAAAKASGKSIAEVRGELE